MQLSAIFIRHLCKSTVLAGLAAIAWASAARLEAAAVSYSDSVVNDRPVVYYRLEEPLVGVDTRSTNIGTGERLHGFYRNFVAGEMAQSGPQTPGFAASNHAPVFDAADNYVERTESPTQAGALDITGNLTLEAWVKLDSGASLTGWPGIVGKYNGSVNQRSYVLRIDSSGRPNFAISDDGYWHSSMDFSANTVLARDQWYHLAATYTPSQSMKIYINGGTVETKQTSTSVGALHNGSAPLWVGAQNTTSADRLFPGQIDEVAVYDKVLTAGQVSAHYAAAGAAAFDPAAIGGLQVWYQVDDGTQISWEAADSSYRTDTWQDSGPGGYDMTQTGDPRPTLLQDQVGGFPALEFDGSNDFMSADDVEVHSNTDGLTVFAVCQPDAAGAHAIVSKYDSGALQRAWLLRTDAFFVMDDRESYVSGQAAFYTPNIDSWQVLTGMWEPGNRCQVYKDGVLAGTAAAPVIDIDDTTSALLLGGQNGGAVARYDGGLAEVLIFNRALTWGEHNAVGWYLARKYGLQTTFAPEPSSALLLFVGMVVALLSRRRRR